MVRHTSLTRTVRSLRSLDDLDRYIIEALLGNPDAKSSMIAKKYNKPLSTIQRRRRIIERDILIKRYSLNRTVGNYRQAILMISARRGDSEATATQIYEKFRQITTITVGMNTEVDIAATLYFRETEELHSIMQEISKMPAISRVQFYEVVKALGERNIDLEWFLSNRKSTNR